MLLTTHKLTKYKDQFRKKLTHIQVEMSNIPQGIHSRAYVLTRSPTNQIEYKSEY